MSKLAVVSFALSLVALGCGSSGSTSSASTSTSSGSTSGSPAGLTFFHDAKPIFDAKCVSCHTDGGIAPFSLETFEAAQPYVALIKQKTADKTMPPWLANDACASYQGDRSLSDAEIATIGTWVDDGAQQGDPSDVGAKIDTGKPIELTRVDKTLTIQGPYTMKTTPDDYHCFVLDWNESAAKYVSGFRANPGNAKVVHHVIAFLAKPADVAAVQAKDDAEPGPGYTCFGGTGVNSNEWLGAWAPGSMGSDFPEGTGILVPAGSKIVLQVHYNSIAAGAQPDPGTSIDFKLDDKVAKEAKIQPWANPAWLKSKTKDSMKIPAMAADTMHDFAFDATYVTGGKAFTLYSAGLHMHQLGTKAILETKHAGGKDECLVQIDKWNFHWQGSYAFTEPKHFAPGDQLYLECHWNNTPPMQPTINGQKQAPKDVWWGEGTTDEMCLGNFYYTID